jgi:hypothetical protein
MRPFRLNPRAVEKHQNKSGAQLHYENGKRESDMICHPIDNFINLVSAGRGSQCAMQIHDLQNQLQQKQGINNE